MKHLKLYLIILTALIISGLYFFINPYRSFSYDYDLKLGEIAEKDIIAPFDFYVQKSPETLKIERELAADKVKPIFKVSESLKFNAQKNLDFFFQQFSENDPAKIKKILSKKGYNFEIKFIRYLSNLKIRQDLYNILSENFTKIFDIGIYPNDYKYQTIKVAKFNRIIPYKLGRLYSLDEAKEKLTLLSSKKIEDEIIKKIADQILIENIIVDQEITKLEKQKAEDKVQTRIGKVQKNEKIIGKNQKVTSLEILKLKSLKQAAIDYHSNKPDDLGVLPFLGVFVLSFFILFLFKYILEMFFESRYSSTQRFIVILSSLLFTIMVTILFNYILVVPSLLIPFSFSVLLIAVIFNPLIGILYNFINLILVALFLHWSIINPVILSLGTLGGIIALKKIKNTQQYYPQTLYLIASFFIAITATSLIRMDSITLYGKHILWGIGSCLISIIAFAIITPLIEKKLNLATKQILLELLNFENPLMQKLSKLAPGTYHHSIIVGNLAESAAEAIGANHLLARVGSYYHDIGKIENPNLFIENNSESTELHDKLMANESSRVIRDHINDGLSLAKKYNLPQPVIQIIRQHHGKGKIKYFYDKAQKTEIEINDEDFHYNGPKPQIKEAAIVMIADIVESTTKSLDDVTEDSIKGVLDRTVSNLIEEEQLNECPITIKELEIIKSYMLPILLGVYRKRLEYPERK